MPGTYLVRRFRSPDHIFGVGALTFFVVDHPRHGAELWRTDGTRAGTFELHGLGEWPAQLEGFTALKGRLLFVDSYVDLWASDGTTRGTVMLRDLYLRRRPDESLSGHR
jgi:hypothetical protein